VVDRAAADLRAAAVMIADAGPAAFPIAALISRAGASPAAVGARISALVAAGQAVRAGDVLVAADTVTQLKQRILASLAEHHRAQPLSPGVPREELREHLFGRGHADVFALALEGLTTAGSVAVRDRVALATHRLELSPDEERAREVIEHAFREGGLKPPDPASIAAGGGIAAAVVDRMLKLLLRQKVLVRVDTLLFHDEALKRLKADVAGLNTSGGAADTGARIDVATFKERFGVSRKFAIPLLEYLDRERVTRRMGDSRVVL
jgi:selenocysteine-specific elongation factor